MRMRRLRRRLHGPASSLQPAAVPTGRRCVLVDGSCGGLGASITMGGGMDVAELRAKIRDIKDFPTEGILFKDITTLLKDGPAFRYVIDTFVQRYRKERVDVVVGIESRGFI